MMGEEAARFRWSAWFKFLLMVYVAFILIHSGLLPEGDAERGFLDAPADPATGW
jgi:hypothetical protein